MSGAQRRRTSTSEVGDAALMILGGRGVGGGGMETVGRLMRERVAGSVARVTGGYRGAVTFDGTGTGSGQYANIVFDDFPPGVWMVTGSVDMTLVWLTPLAEPSTGLFQAGCTDGDNNPVGDTSVLRWPEVPALATVGGANGEANFPAMIVRDRYLKVACLVLWPDDIADPDQINWGVTIRAQRISD